MSKHLRKKEAAVNKLPRKFSKSQARQLGDIIGINWKKYDLEQFRTGLGVETEHAETIGQNRKALARIVLDHLNEHPKYYTNLLKFEKRSLAKKSSYHVGKIVTEPEWKTQLARIKAELEKKERRQKIIHKKVKKSAVSKAA